MGQLLSAQGLAKYAGGKLLFSNLRLNIEEGERVVLIGANGSGKSTLLRILSGLEEPDEGDVTVRRTVQTALIPQQDSFEDDQSVEYALSSALRANSSHPGDLHGRTAETLGKCGFTDKHQKVGSLSGGWKKRLAIARALVLDPDLLFLDEPTNHLDIDGITWLENFLNDARFASLVVSHDRYFMENIATRVIELDRRYEGFTLSGEGRYSDFMEKRSNFLDGQKQYYASLANKVRREISWLRQGARARTTKARGRIKGAHRLIGELRNKPEGQGKAELEFCATGRRSKEVLKAERLGFSIGGKVLFKDLNFTLAPGDRLGILGPNGSGKTSLQRVLYGGARPTEGKIRRAFGSRCVIFDQNRESLDGSLTLKEALCPEGDAVLFQGRETHVTSWAKRFLFDPSQLSTPVGSLSGGEQSRVLISRLMLEPADILFLDEPTNDLDIPTLEVLEESLEDFPGVIIITSHDRFLLDNLSTLIVGLHGDGISHIYADYGQWAKAHEGLKKRPRKIKGTDERDLRGAKPGKLSYMDQRDYDTIEAQIMEAESRHQELQSTLTDPDNISNAPKLEELCREIALQEEVIRRLYARWEDLAEKVKNLQGGTQ